MDRAGIRRRPWSPYAVNSMRRQPNVSRVTRLLAPGLALLLFTGVLAGCVQPAPAASPTVGPTPADAFPPTRTPFPFTQEEITVEAADGLRLAGVIFLPAAGGQALPGVVLLHQLQGFRHEWDDLAPLLAQAGFAVLALDMRGHGETGGVMDWGQAEDDLQRAWDYFTGRPDVQEESTAVVGASIGSNMALRMATAESSIRGVVLLSPGLDYRGVTTEDALASYGDRPLLIVASQGDRYAADSARSLTDQAAGEVELVIFEGDDHGVGMFPAEPGLAPRIIDWLLRILALS